MTTIKIKCPNCGKVLIVQDDPSNATKSVRCPVCREKNPFTAFKPVVSVPVEDKTEFDGVRVEDRTFVSLSAKVFELGYLLDEKTRRKYPLEEGLNLVGRLPVQALPLADVAIDTDDNGLSRKHFVIEVSKSPDGAVRHWVSNAGNKNPTFINGVMLNDGDKVILRDGYVIASSQTELTFHLA